MVNNHGENYGVLADTINGNVEITVHSHNEKIPSLLPKFIEKLATLSLSEPDKGTYVQSNQPYTIEDKISHNEVFTYVETIEDYYPYYYICEKALDTIENLEYGSKVRILEDIKEVYNFLKRKLISEKKQEGVDVKKVGILAIVRENADEIIDMVKERIEKKIKECYSQEEFCQEDLTLCLNIFICYAFGECKILERPPIKQCL